MTKLKFNGVVTEVYTTPEKDKVNSIETGANKTEFATTSEATTATNNTKAMTPLRTKEAILALTPPPDLSGYATTIALDEKVDKVTGMGLSKNDYTDVEKNKLAGIATGANNYTHPSTHPATMITQDPNNRFSTDTEKTTWSNKQDTLTAGTNVTINASNVISATDTTYGVASASANGLMSSAMWTKLNGLYNMVYLTESAYTALGTKDPNTLYLRY